MMVGRTSGLLRVAATALALGLALLGCEGSHPHAPRQYVAPTPPSAPLDPRTSAVLGFAQAQVGKRYCWGGSGPRCFDCSGLVQAAWRWAGVALPRTSDAQGRVLHQVPLDDVRAGDILWWRGHVGLYVGNGEMIDAYHSGAGVVRRRAVVPERVLRVMVSPS